MRRGSGPGRSRRSSTSSPALPARRSAAPRSRCTAVPEKHPNRWWTLAAVCVATFMLLLDITVVNVALPDIAKDLHSSFSELQWVVDAYALGLASFLLTTGKLADRFGLRRSFVHGPVGGAAAAIRCRRRT